MKVYQLLRDEGPLHFYELIMRSRLARSTVHLALVELGKLGLIAKDEKTDLYRAA